MVKIKIKTVVESNLCLLDSVKGGGGGGGSGDISCGFQGGHCIYILLGWGGVIQNMDDGLKPQPPHPHPDT